MAGSCLICDRIDLIRKGKNKSYIHELRSGFVVFGDTQFNRGYTLLLSKIHASELHHLNNDDLFEFLHDMTTVSKAVWHAFSPDKLNYELLGNTDNHLHWHIIPRYKEEAAFGKPYWTTAKEIRNAKEHEPSEKELAEMKEKILTYFYDFL